jgi:hypothetical protein
MRLGREDFLFGINRIATLMTYVGKFAPVRELNRIRSGEAVASKHALMLFSLNAVVFAKSNCFILARRAGCAVPGAIKERVADKADDVGRRWLRKVRRYKA